MKIVIVGAGQAAASMAARLRAKGHTGPLTLIGEEPLPPYQRPPLSKAYLLGDMGLDRLILRSDDWWRDEGIDLQTDTQATAIDAAARQVLTDRGSVDYDVLALTTGAYTRRLPAAMGGDLAGVHVIRTLGDVDRLQPALAAARRVIVLGGGYVGLEGAAVARKLGKDVTLIEASPRILGRVASAETADMLRARHVAHGVTILEGTAISAISGDEAATGVDLLDGEHLPADLILCGIGALPRIDLAETAALELDNGIAVDAFGRTSDAAIWSAGDCASFPTSRGRLRLESVGNAIDMAEAVADNILGADTPYRANPWFWSDQYDAKLQIAGWNAGYDRVVTRGNSVWYFHGDTLLAVDALNDPRAYMVGKRLIEAGRSPDPDAVASAPDLKALM
ncbi:MAG: pyridine nucleotide-disulfide oxidoreductase [Paracoccus denitrificans]|nr:MAG: pyridine nucleotide-disulfide oxidoreductase [Paracoccus denitrificans]PZO85248.1 MAG: pyridine nucleotide-disulfide oxidoreductase [Paracoccus denitrificans]